MPRIYVSGGSNIDRKQHCSAAIAALRMRYGELVLSRVYETVAEGFDGDPFYNFVVGFDTDEGPMEVADFLRRVEEANGRVRGGDKFSARTLDLDLLLYGDEVFTLGRLDIPRDEIDRYAFVLGPLAEIAGERRHPRSGRRFDELWAEFSASDDALVPVTLE